MKRERENVKHIKASDIYALIMHKKNALKCRILLGEEAKPLS